MFARVPLFVITVTAARSIYFRLLALESAMVKKSEGDIKPTDNQGNVKPVLLPESKISVIKQPVLMETDKNTKIEIDCLPTDHVFLTRDSAVSLKCEDTQDRVELHSVLALSTIEETSVVESLPSAPFVLHPCSYQPFILSEYIVKVEIQNERRVYYTQSVHVMYFFSAKKYSHFNYNSCLVRV